MVIDCDLLGQQTVSIQVIESVTLAQLKCTVLLLAVKIADPVIENGLRIDDCLKFSRRGVGLG